MKMNIALVPGDGIGPDIVREACRVLDKIASIYGHEVHYEHTLAGGIAIDKTGCCLPEETLEKCHDADAVILGAVGGPKWDNVPGPNRPEKALLGLRSALGLFCNLRPALMYKELSAACPLKKELVEDGLDIMVVRELTGGIYFGEHKRSADKEYAEDIMAYSKSEVQRIARKAFDAAMLRNKRLCSVDKANVLECSRLWRSEVDKVALDYPEVTVTHMYVDNAAMQLVRNPRQFDVILTENMFGDILSDEASQITGSIGMLPSASLREDKFGMYEPIHGSAPDIAGKNLANPMATILSVAMMLRYTFGLTKEADSVERAVALILENGYRSADIFTEGMKMVGTKEMGDAVLSFIE